MTAEGAKLSWNPPADDGGQPVENYVVEKLDEATGRWVPAGETVGPETNIALTGLTPGHKYKFRVRAVNKQGKSDPLTSDKYVEAKNPFGKNLVSIIYVLTRFDTIYRFCFSNQTNPVDPVNPPSKITTETLFNFNGARPETDGGSPITGYVIERKTKYS